MSNVIMDKTHWMKIVQQNEKYLTSLVADYHPSSGKSAWDPEPTAPGAAQACKVISAKIREENPEDPVSLFSKAIKDGDILLVYSILSSTWFGVPEHTNCWRIPGFSVAVNLLDDPPEMEQEDV